MQEYEGLARKIARMYTPYCNGAVDYEDLMQAAAIGAILADATYSPDKGSWVSWVAYYIRTEMRAAVGIRTGKRDPSSIAISLDKPITEDGMTLADTLCDADTCIAEDVERKELQQTVREAVSILPSDHRRLIEMIYFENRSKTETAKTFGCSAYRLSILKQKAFRDLRYNPKICALAVMRGFTPLYRGYGENPSFPSG